MSKLRFATLIRVSTKGQDKEDGSLSTQRKQLIGYVKSLGGKITNRYGGQEHAVEGYERKELDKLLADAALEKFDAVIVCDPDRWSRDNVKSKAALRILRDNKIRFFAATMEYDLCNPAAVLFLGLAAEIGEFTVTTSKLKSIHNRIERAKKGIPTGGKLPFGRTFEDGKWGVDPEKQKLIKDAARRYIRGESILKIAASYDMNHTILWRTLSLKCGDTWELVFKPKKMPWINETITFKIPRLLSEETIATVRKRCAANRTYLHGELKNKYLLGRVIYCSYCGTKLMAQSVGKYSYYRNQHNLIGECSRPAGCNQIPTAKIENMILLYLYDTFGNSASLKAAIDKATPNQEQIKQARIELKTTIKELNLIEKQRARFIEGYSKGMYTEEEGRKLSDKLKSRKQILTDKRIELDEQLKAVPLVSTLKLGQLRRNVCKKPLNEMSYKEKKALVQKVFGGKAPNGDRLGVYIRWQTKKDFMFDIKGQLFDERDLPMLSESMQKAVFAPDEFYTNSSDERQLQYRVSDF